MGNGKRYAKFQANLFSGNEIKSIFCPPLFRKQPIHIFNTPVTFVRSFMLIA